MTLSPKEIIATLSKPSGRMPKAAFKAAVAQREVLTPELLSLLEHAAADLEAFIDGEESMGHLSAMYLLAQFRETRAHTPLVRLVRADPDILGQALGDVVSEGLDRLLASTCVGDYALIKRLIEDVVVDEYVRGAALRALVICVREGDAIRDEVVAYLRQLFRGTLDGSCDIFNSFLVSCCCDLFPGELMGDIEMAYARDLVDTGFISRSSVLRVLEAGEERTLAKLHANPEMRYIRDVIRDMHW